MQEVPMPTQTSDETPTTTEANARREPALLYRVTEAAVLLGISRTNVYYLMNDGRLGSVRIGSRRLIPRAALESFVEGLAQAS
jgi:excisionase family DNA binding protein